MTPRSVQLLSQATPFQTEMNARLITDHRMDDVWSWLLRMQNAPPDQASRLEAVQEKFGLRTWGVVDTCLSTADQLCGAFFLYTLHNLSTNQFSATRTQMDTEADRWLKAAEICDLSYGDSMLSPIDPGLHSKLPDLANHFRRIGKLISNEDSPRVLPKPGKNDLLRAHVRTFAQGTQLMFGTKAYGIVGKVVTVALDLQNLLEKGTVEDWCKDLPLLAPSQL